MPNELEVASSYVSECMDRLKGNMRENDWVAFWKDMERAKQIIDSSLSANPDDPDVKNQLGRWHLCKAQEEGRLKSKLKKAISHMEQAVTLLPETAKYHVALGLMYADSGKGKLAVEQLEHAVRLEPENMEFRKELDRVKSQAKSCFIATAAYGSADSPPVLVLRSFRDEVLLQSRLGRRWVRVYYRFSPSVAYVLTERPTLRRVVRYGLDFFVVRACTRILRNRQG